MSDDIFIFDETGTILIGVKDKTIRRVIIPNRVKSIGDFAFDDCSGLTSVTIPDGVINIGNYAFHECSGLVSVTIGNSVTNIGHDAFRGCRGLTSINIPSSVTSIRESTFSSCRALTSVAIPSSVTWIGDFAFQDCSSLTSVTIPDSVKSIGRSTFNGCSSLTSIEIPSSVTSIGDYAFSGCSGITSIVVESDNVVYDSRDNCNAIIEKASNTLIAGCKNTWIPSNVTSIGHDAFNGCSSLTSVVIPDSVSSIGVYAFSGCSGLTSVTIGNSVTNIGSCLFKECSSLNSVFLGKNVKNIGDYAFYGCRKLQKIIIPKSVEHIGEFAFDGCPISKVHLPNSTKYEEHSFDVITKVMKCLISISYSWDNEGHKVWVKKLADDLESNGIEVVLDQKNLSLGEQLTTYMEKSILKADRVLCILTPAYKEKCDERKNGAGYEASIISSKMLQNVLTSKFIPVLRTGDWNESSPVFLEGRKGINMKNDDDYEKKLKELIDDILYKTDDVIS